MLFCEDIHVHTHLSTCACPEADPKEYLKKAKDVGFDLIGFADHMWDLNVHCYNNWYLDQGYENVSKLRDELSGFTVPDVKYLFGCEVEYDPREHDIALTEEVAKKFDFIIVPNSHTHMMLPPEIDKNDLKAHSDFMMRAFFDIIRSPRAKYVTSIAHPFMAVGSVHQQELVAQYSDAILHDCFSECAEKNIALEINASLFRGIDGTSDEEYTSYEFYRFFSIAKECGCKFTYGGDRHTAVNYRRSKKADRFAELLGLTENDVVYLKNRKK